MRKRQKVDQSISFQESKGKSLEPDRDPGTSIMTMVNTDCFINEEQEALSVDSDDEFSLFKETCGQFRELFTKVYTAKKEKRSEEEICNLRLQACPLFLTLKKLNRLDKHRCKKTRDDVAERKQKVDSLHLQLQNLLYEIMHLQKEVTKCLEFRSKDEEIELVPVEEFYKEAPDNIIRSERTRNDSHELTLARLEWELEQRKRFSEQLKEAEKTTEEYKVIIHKRKECLDNILPILTSILESTEPLQSKLGMPFQATQLKHKPALLLPRPLYTLYVQACAYQEACDKKISINVEGNIEDATVLQLKVDDVDEDSGESDQEDNSHVKRHRHSISEKRVDSSRNILNKHPLSVYLTVHGGEGKISIEFFYLFNLKIVTAAIKSLSPQPTSGVYAGEVLQLDTILNCLFPRDYGVESPNPANNFQLQTLKYDDSPFLNSTTGYPYVWAQRLAGLEFLPRDIPSNEFKPPSTISSSCIERTICFIRSRLLSRMCLYNQLLTLENTTTSIIPELASSYPPKTLSLLKRWNRVSWEEVLNHPSYTSLQELNVINEEVIVFKAVIERGSASLSALILIFPDYPTKSPLFLLLLQWKAIYTPASSDTLRELEEEVNVHCVEMVPEKCIHSLLMCQVHHLLMCFDVFLETEAAGDTMEGPREFSQEKVVTRHSRGRNHSRPYKYISNQGIFTQR